MSCGMEKAISLYFSLGLGYNEILTCLVHINGIIVSNRTLKRALKRMNLFRRGKYSDIVDIALFLTEQQQVSGKCLGYKMMHLKCIQNGLIVTQEIVRLLMQIINPQGVKLRRRHRLLRREYFNYGPNFLWHMDSYDKLKPYGICINGAIDGFSRNIVLLEAHKTSSDPRLIAGYFLQEVKGRKGCPTRIRADKGTENGHVKEMLSFLRRNNQDHYANNCFLVGSSNHNQRIEQWWGTLRKMNSQHWIDTFGILKTMDLFVGGFLDKSLIQFCFMDLIQSELDEVVKLWNTHRIRPSKHLQAPGGRPVVMYSCGGLYDAQDYLCEVSDQEVDFCLEESRQKGPFCCDETVFEICQLLMEEHRRQNPTCMEDGILLYQFLRREILNELD